ncbi:hypothetical protein F8566_17500 [Actinomadura rudentiformis]|uniref:Uncharacterized protein n=1 Tax=Actinomadura rudentiformis TaxID=359158 RepID=A0A6H9Z1Z1_9ACTN|nr:hypothetical protein F8566_17500 [Actinomadura rudentiformis]
MLGQLESRLTEIFMLDYRERLQAARARLRPAEDTDISADHDCPLGQVKSWRCTCPYIAEGSGLASAPRRPSCRALRRRRDLVRGRCFRFWQRCWWLCEAGNALRCEG